MKILEYIAQTVRNISSRRIYLDGEYLLLAGFTPGAPYTVETKGARITLVLNKGLYRVCKKVKRGKEVSVIDLNSRRILGCLDGLESVRIVIAQGVIHILPLSVVIRHQERMGRLAENLAKGVISTASVAAGAVVMGLAIHEGLVKEGFTPSMVYCCEARPDVWALARNNNPVVLPGTIGIVAPMQEAINDEWFAGKIPRTDVLEFSIPCSGASRAGRSKLKTSCAEEHPDVGHLVHAALQYVTRSNPAVVIWENVPEYAETASGYILRYQLRDMGYKTHETVLVGSDYNCLENRRRWCLVATSPGIEFDFALLEKPLGAVRNLSEILDEIPDDDPRWSKMQGLKDKEVRDKTAGKGFAMQIFDPTSTRISTITKGYAKVRSPDPKIAHPTNPDMLRQLTPSEHARIKGIPEGLIAGASSTLAHEVLGQSVLFAPFVSVGNLVAKSLKRWFATAKAPNTPDFALARPAG